MDIADVGVVDYGMKIIKMERVVKMITVSYCTT